MARLGGHPLQTALWGEARRRADRIENSSYAALVDGEIVWAARVESRRVPLVGRVAWVPKGPTAGGGTHAAECEREWLALLRREGFLLCVVDPWKEAEPEGRLDDSRGSRPWTIWIDLSQGREQLWADLDKQWRYGVGRAGRLGVKVECTHEARDLDAFFAMCAAVSHRKRFRLPVSRLLLTELLSQPEGGDSEARLFVARVGDSIASGALVLRCGRSVHYFLGATDRAHSEARSAEAAQWAIVEWALACGCSRYDLEGIDPVNNPGVYAFKKKMGGREIALCGARVHSLSLRGSLLESVRRALPTRRIAGWVAG